MASVVGVPPICRLPCLQLPQQTRRHFSFSFLEKSHYSSNCILEASSCTRNLEVRCNRIAPSATATVNTTSDEEAYDEQDTFFDGFHVATASEDDDDERQVEASSGSDELSVSKLGLPEELVEALEKRDIIQLFPIQRAVLVPALEGRDLIARAKTGTGKTLAFGIPVIKRLAEDESSSRRQHGRPPKLLVLAPTRELAKQVEKEFQLSAPFLDTICVYGGVSYNAQQSALSRGVDIVVGTPGRIIDLLNGGSLDLGEIGYLVLDEADQMLAVGFEEDVELILDKLPEERQSMLFSATMPGWVNKLARKYLNDPLTIDLVGDEDEKLPDGIKLYALSAAETAKRSILADLITLYAKGGKTIVFTKTKQDADNVSMALASNVTSEALHGDISQYSRERTLNGFRDGKFTVLVATDVAARGLDIPNVDLVIHYELPSDPETFVHRSGRTGRAGKEGTAILMYTSSQRRTVKTLEQDVGCSFVFISPPTFDEVLESSSTQVVATLNRVHPECTKYFSQTAQNLIDEKGTSALAAALAQLCGFSRPPTVRSLLTHEEGLMTLQLARTKGFVSARTVNGSLADMYPAAAREIGKIYTIADTTVRGAVFDLPEQIANDLLQMQPPPGTQICKVSKLPPLQDDGPRYDDYGRYSARDDCGRYSGRERGSWRRSRQNNDFRNSRGWNRREHDDEDEDEDEYSRGGSRHRSDSKWFRHSSSSRNNGGWRRKSRLTDATYWKR